MEFSSFKLKIIFILVDYIGQYVLNWILTQNIFNCNLLINNSNLRNPSLASLDGKECKHCNKAVIIVKVLSSPFPFVGNWREISIYILEIHSSKQENIKNILKKENKLRVEQCQQ